MTFQDLPTVNAVLNSVSAVLLTLGFVEARKRNLETHRRYMLSAAVTSTLFLVSYLTYHFQVGATHFQAQGLVKSIYFVILISHTILAALAAPLVLLTLWRALRGDFIRHKRVARWTWPVWMVVSVTGVLIYLLLYHYPGASS